MKSITKYNYLLPVLFLLFAYLAFYYGYQTGNNLGWIFGLIFIALAFTTAFIEFPKKWLKILG